MWLLSSPLRSYIALAVVAIVGGVVAFAVWANLSRSK